jgi:hypothetical protein
MSPHEALGMARGCSDAMGGKTEADVISAVGNSRARHGEAPPRPTVVGEVNMGGAWPWASSASSVTFGAEPS